MSIDSIAILSVGVIVKFSDITDDIVNEIIKTYPSLAGCVCTRSIIYSGELEVGDWCDVLYDSIGNAEWFYDDGVFGVKLLWAYSGIGGYAEIDDVNSYTETIKSLFPKSKIKLYLNSYSS